MENSLAFKRWILERAEKGLIEISKVSWPQRLGLQIQDYAASVKVGNEVFTGHGTSTDADTAISKAVAETFERYKVWKLRLNTSNGCSAHPSEKESRERARFELLERDCFLYKYITADAFHQIDDRILFFDAPNSILSNYLLYDGSKFKISMTRVAINEKSNIFGLGIAADRSAAIFSSEVEALRQWAHLFYFKNYKSHPFNSLISGDGFSFDDHGDVALTSDHFLEIKHLFIVKDNKSKYAEPIGEFRYLTQFSEQDYESPFFEIPLYFTKAYNDFVQELFTGSTATSINPNRIPTDEVLNLCLHPLR